MSDSSWGGAAISATVDLLGRTISYSDIWGETTTTAYDTAGRVASTTGPLGTMTQQYDAATGRPSVFRDGANNALATEIFDAATGRRSRVNYFSGAHTTFGYDTYGRPTSTTVNDTSGPTGESLVRSLAGRVVDQSVFHGSGLIDAAPSAPNFSYDGAGRLVEARLPTATYAYGYGAASGCAAPNAGRNTNRTSVAITGAGAGVAASCYDAADRLVSTSAIPAGDIAYDDHGNTTRLGAEFLTYDGADRHVGTEGPASITTYRRDPLDRIVERTDTARITHVATAHNSAASNALTVPRPAGAAAGDLLLASVTASGITVGAITASGWTAIAERSNGSGRTFVLRRNATASDPSSFDFSVATALNVTAAVSAYRGPSGTTPVATQATGAATVSTIHPLPQLTTTTPHNHLIHVLGVATNTAITAPGGTASRANVSSGASLLVVDRPQPSAGSSSAISATTSTFTNSASVSIALAPAVDVTRYMHAGHADKALVTRDGAGVMKGFSLPLAGGAAFSLVGGAYRYAHANTHGDVVTVTSDTGARVWTGHSGPYGESGGITGPPTTTAVGTTLGWHGNDGRVTDRGIVHMGARPYSIAHGRFLGVDPIEGGCANDYVYVFGDPVNASDLNGLSWYNPLSWTACGVAKVAGNASRILGGAAVVVGIGAVTFGTGGLAAAGLGIAATGASGVQWAAGARAGDRAAATNGAIGTTVGLLTLGAWGAVSTGLYGASQPLSTRLVAGAGLYANTSRLLVYESAGASNKDRC